MRILGFVQLLSVHPAGGTPRWGGESDVKLSYIFPCLRAGGEKLEVINCVCVRSSLIFPQGQLQPWTDRWLRGVHAF